MTDKPDAGELLPCPFCSRLMQQHDKHPTEYRHAYARNDRCPAGATVIYIDDAPAVAAWNRRSSSKRIEELEGAITQLLPMAMAWVDHVDAPNDRAEVKRIHEWFRALSPSSRSEERK